MLSIRSSRQIHGSPISLAALSRLERREFPLKLSELAQVTTQNFSNRIATGDVTVDWTATFASNGSWSTSAHIVDSGDLSGDYYVLEYLLSTSRNVGNRLNGDIDKGDSVDLSASGIDPWIRENWSEIIDKGVTIKLEVLPNVAGIITGALTLLAAGAAVVFLGGKGSVEMVPCTEGFENDQPCVEIKKT